MVRRSASITQADIADNEPIRLSVAAALAFPDGSMTASGLRREAARGRLTIERIAGKDFTTLQAINQMRERCRVTAKVQDSGCSHRDGTNTVESSNKPCRSSAIAGSNEALVSARAKLRKLSERSPTTSPSNTAPLESATSISSARPHWRVSTASLVMLMSGNAARRQQPAASLRICEQPSDTIGRQRWRNRPSDRATAQHVARFILLGLYTGTRAGAICSAALMPTIGRGYVDLDAGVFYRRAAGTRETKKRQPPVRLPPRVLAHLRRWHRRRLALRSVIEWNGEPVRRVNKAFRSVRQAAGLGPDVVPHTLRHTAITWQAQLGVPMHEICGFFGITPDMFDRVYGHHHPDYQANAVNALSRHRPTVSRQISRNQT